MMMSALNTITLSCRSASVTSSNTRGRVNPEMSSGAMTRSSVVISSNPIVMICTLTGRSTFSLYRWHR